MIAPHFTVLSLMIRFRPQPESTPVSQIYQIIRLYKLICATAFLKENGLVVINVGKLVESCPTDGRLTPLDLPVVQLQLEVTIGLERNKALSTPSPKVERFVEPNIFEIA